MNDFLDGAHSRCLACGDLMIRRGRIETCDCPQRGYESAKHYPTDPRGLEDDGAVEHPAKSCCKRINHENVSRFETSVTWCCLESGHAGQCSGPLPTILEPNELGPTGKAPWAPRRRW